MFERGVIHKNCFKMRKGCNSVTFFFNKVLVVSKK